MKILQNLLSKFRRAPVCEDKEDSEEIIVFESSEVDISDGRLFRLWWQNNKAEVKKRSIKNNMINLKNVAREAFFAGIKEGRKAKDHDSNNN